MTAAVRTLKPCGTHAAYHRHKERGEPIDEACRDARSWRAGAVESRRRARSLLIAREIVANGGAKPFQIPRCADCRAPLSDAAGEPRWDLLEGRFVCLSRCPKGARRG